MLAIPKKFKLKGKVIDYDKSDYEKPSLFERVYHAVLSKLTASKIVDISDQTPIYRLVNSYNSITSKRGMKHLIFLNEWNNLYKIMAGRKSIFPIYSWSWENSPVQCLSCDFSHVTVEMHGLKG
ncbi:hypothetical protein BC833DRAFT_662979 [Globomyces pollinis-pini]|nr:hypothetical protein BC833DRAFT_662979 [Globomyces pollinis-pini]